MTEVSEATNDRVSRFEQEVHAIRVRGGTVARERLLARLGAALLLAGIVVGVVAYSMSYGTDDVREQNDATILALVGVSVSVAGLALFLRYSLGAVLRLWLARLVADRERSE